MLKPQSSKVTAEKAPRLIIFVAGILVIGFPGNQLTPGKYLTRTEGWKNEWSADRDYDFLTEIPFRVIAGP